MRLLWQIPSGQWSRIRLVRNSYGFPVTEDDGQVLIDSNSGPAATGTLDSPVSEYDDRFLTEGSFYYYSLFVLALDAESSTTEWRRAGDTIGLSPRNFGYTGKMLDRIPSVFTTYAQETGGKFDAGTPLARFISIFGFDLDFVRSQYETLRDLQNPDKISGGMLPILAEQFGLSYEPEVGIRQTRILLRNLMTIRKRKGTAVGIEALASSFTGWGAEAQRGVNLVLDYDDSSFEDSLGKWRAEANCTISRLLGDAYISPVFSNLQLGQLVVTATGGDASVRLLQGGRDPITTGIPVTGGLSYTASVFARAGQAQTRAVAIDIEWYDQRGLLLATSLGPTTTSNVAGNWSARATNSAAAPATAAYAGLALRVIGALAGETHRFDAVQLEQSAAATAFQEARDLRVVLAADRINEVPNPSAEIDVAGWAAAGSNTTLARGVSFAYSGDPAQLAPAAPQTASFRLTATAVGNVLAETALLPVLSNTPYTLTSYAHVATGKNVLVSLLWYDAADAYLGASVGAVVLADGTRWVRPFVTSISPVNATQCRVQLQAQGLAATATAYFDAVLLERTIRQEPYFDAANNVQRIGDYIWEGTAHFSRSHYYFNRTTKNGRLRQLVRDHLAIGTAFSLLYAQPA